MIAFPHRLHSSIEHALKLAKRIALRATSIAAYFQKLASVMSARNGVGGGGGGGAGPPGLYSPSEYCACRPVISRIVCYLEVSPPPPPPPPPQSNF